MTIAVALTSLGLAAHIGGVVLRGLAVHRLPWGDMYEFVTALTCVAVAFFLGVMLRYRAYYLGLFVMAAVVLVLGLAETVIYTPAGPLVPALQSYWLAIHVTAMTLATGVFFVAAVIGIAYLFVDRHARRVAAGRPTGSDGILRRLPRPEVLDRLAYRTVVFGFPIWTFGVMAGVIWADRAWGSYWSWDSHRDLGLHHLGGLRVLPARQGDRRVARPPRGLHPAGRLRLPAVQRPRDQLGRPRPALLRGPHLTRATGVISLPLATPRTLINSTLHVIQS